MSLNGIDVLNKSHAEVVQIAQNSKVLILEVARTCDVLNPESAEVHGGQPLYCGYLWKLGGHASGLPSNKWVRRWFSLKSDHCLYYYKTDSDHQPVGATMLLNYDIYRVADKSSELPPRQFRFDIKKIGVPILHLAADTEKAILRWIEVLKDAVEQLKMTDNWLQRARRNLLLSPGALVKPDCFGYLVKIGDEWKSFNRRYCVLKDACLYFYQDVNAGNAFGVACLHGYKVRQPPKDIDKHSFEIIPSDPNQKYFYFCTETDMDKKRWVTALETSIQRWINVD